MAGDASRRALVEGVTLHPSDAERAEEGGADRLYACVLDEGEQRSVEPREASAIVRPTSRPIRVTLRLSLGFSTMGGELTSLQGLVTDYLSVGVEGTVALSDLDARRQEFFGCYPALSPLTARLEAREGWAHPRKPSGEALGSKSSCGIVPRWLNATLPWFVDETYVKVAGRWTYLYRAIDQDGQVIDVWLSRRRDLIAAGGSSAGHSPWGRRPSRSPPIGRRPTRESSTK